MQAASLLDRAVEHDYALSAFDMASVLTRSANNLMGNTAATSDGGGSHPVTPKTAHANIDGVAQARTAIVRGAGFSGTLSATSRQFAVPAFLIASSTAGSANLRARLLLSISRAQLLAGSRDDARMLCLMALTLCTPAGLTAAAALHARAVRRTRDSTDKTPWYRSNYALALLPEMPNERRRPAEGIDQGIISTPRPGSLLPGTADMYAGASFLLLHMQSKKRWTPAQLDDALNRSKMCVRAATQPDHCALLPVAVVQDSMKEAAVAETICTAMASCDPAVAVSVMRLAEAMHMRVDPGAGITSLIAVAALSRSVGASDSAMTGALDMCFRICKGCIWDADCMDALQVRTRDCSFCYSSVGLANFSRFGLEKLCFAVQAYMC